MAEGQIMLSARAQFPQTWDALARSSIFGSEFLQLATDAVKWRQFGVVVDPLLELTLYNPMGCMILGKQVAVQVIPAGADYWSDQLISETTSGTNESVTYPDRINSLWKIHARLLSELKELQQEFDAIFGRTAVRRMSMPTVSDSDVPMVTPNPYLSTPSLTTTWPAYLGLLPWAQPGRVVGLVP
jgi:hypothetical protein